MDVKYIALTFDDGPDPRYTPEILDILQKYEAKATFFVIGQRAERYPDLVQRQANEGHEIANHTYDHTYFTNGMTVEAIQEEILKGETIIRQIIGQKPNLFRPPGGFYNDQIIQASKLSKYQLVLWSWHQDTKDWKIPGVEKIVNKVVNNARNGDIILLHDHVERNSQTVKALEDILPRLQQAGFTFVTVSELIDSHLSKLHSTSN